MPKIHKCAHCSRVFKRAEHLRRHERSHNGEKPYVCHCGASFSRSDLLRRHERLSHADGQNTQSPVTEVGFSSSLASEQPDAGSSGPTVQSLPPNNTSTVQVFDFNSSCVDFEALTRSVGLHIDWLEPSLYETFVAQEQDEVPRQHEDLTSNPTSNIEKRSNGPMPFTSRLIENSLGMGFNQVQFVRQNPNSSPLIMTEDRHKVLKSNLQLFQGILEMNLPSCHTFTKYLSAWEESLESHLPYIHIPTLRLDDCIPELVLALAAMGAQQRYEIRTSLMLYHAGKTIALERLHKARTHNDDSQSVSQLASTLLTLIIFATWSADSHLVDEALELHRPLIVCLRKDGLDEYDTPSQDWCSWAWSETRNRMKLMSFCFLNLHTIGYNHPPAILWHEVDLKLPCTVREWQAMDAVQWLIARQDVTSEQQRFPESLKALLSSEASQIQPAPSPFGNYLLIHGLLQRIYLARQLAVTQNLREEDVIELYKALSNWATTWQRTSESSLNPRDQNGPIAFTSVALLGLAHVRLHLDIGPHRHLASRVPARVAAGLKNVSHPQLQHDGSSATALLYSIHALSIPVAIGIEYVVNSQAIFWCCQHSLGSLECAVFLSRWLYALDVEGRSMTQSEKRVIFCLRQVISEAVASADWGDVDTSLWLEDAFHMGLAVLRIWSRVFSNSSAWPITVIIGKSLAIDADSYEKRLL